MMIFIGVALTAGFVFALHSQISAYQLGQAEERLRGKLDDYTDQQKFLMLDQQRALNINASDRAGRQNGLDQLKLDQPSALNNGAIQKIVHQGTSPLRSTQAEQGESLNDGGQNSSRSIQRPVKTKHPLKSAKSAKAAKVRKVVRSTAAKSSARGARMTRENARANVAKAQKDNRSDNRRQASPSERRR